jgi:hypothetical protein
MGSDDPLPVHLEAILGQREARQHWLYYMDEKPISGGVISSKWGRWLIILKPLPPFELLFWGSSADWLTGSCPHLHCQPMVSFLPNFAALASAATKIGCLLHSNSWRGKQRLTFCKRCSGPSTGCSSNTSSSCTGLKFLYNHHTSQNQLSA